MDRKKVFKRIFVITMAVAMVFAMSATAFAQENFADYALLRTNQVKVSVTQNNFDTSGNYVGGGTPLAFNVNGNPNVYITNQSKSVAQFNQIATTTWKRAHYLPSNVPNPLPGKASVVDAILNICEMNGLTTQSGWDSYNTPNGGYISNLNNITLPYNVTYYQGANGNKWGHATGSGWQIAYRIGTGNYIVSATYLTSTKVAPNMEIIMDLSPFDMTWDTGQPWQ